MAIESLRLYHFRNLVDGVIQTDSRDVFLVGENGHGKTNFLEAIYFVCYASSFRTKQDDHLCRDGESEMLVEAHYQVGKQNTTVTIKQLGRTKEMFVDGVTVRDRRQIVGTIPCIVFCHDDIVFVSGPPQMQRWFMNQTLALLDSFFVDELRRYNRILRSRNAALRERRVELLDALDYQLVEAGVKLQKRRSERSIQFDAILRELFGEVFERDEILSMRYRPSWNTDIDSLVSWLRERRGRDIDLRTSTTGPHRDKFDFYLGDRLFTEIASTGQLRLVSLILRITQARLLAEIAEQSPILLLDDVLLELDPRRRRRFLAAMPDYQQAFFTFLPDEQYSRYKNKDTLIYNVENGAIHG